MVLTDNQLAYYKHDGDLTDAAGSLDGTNNGTTNNPTGKINQDRDYDGSNDWTTYPDAAFDNFSTSDKSVSMWVKFDSTNATQMIMAPDGNNQGPSFYIETNGVLTWQVFDGARKKVTSSSISTTGYYHLVGIYRQGNNIEMYINGVSQGTTAVGTAIYFASKQLTLGRQGTTSNFYFNGQIDEFGTWNRAITPAEVAELYNGGAGVQYPYSAVGGVSQSLSFGGGL